MVWGEVRAEVLVVSSEEAWEAEVTGLDGAQRSQSNFLALASLR